MTVTGALIGDGLRPGAEFAPPGTRIRRIHRLDLTDSAAPTQPTVRTA